METLFIFNLTIFAVGTSYVEGIKYGQQAQRALANISMATAFALFVVIICYHLFKFVLSKTSIWPKMTERMNSDQERLRRTKYAKKQRKERR